MANVKHEFTKDIIKILEVECFGQGKNLLKASPLLQYLNIKTKAASRGSKSRPSFANLYALYVLIEDYLIHGFDENGEYETYEGAQFSQLFKRQRELPFGSKLQNHALNHRLNEEFKRYFPEEGILPIIRDIQTNRYWINEGLLIVDIEAKHFNIADSVLKIIDAYVEARTALFNSFVEECKALLEIKDKDLDSAFQFIKNLLRPNTDARIFEIVSYSILKHHYADKLLYWGWNPDELNEEFLMLYKTGRTNANDGGIDFVMKPLGRFFQVTETIDTSKYFLDIDKVQRYPITFVVKTEDPVKTIEETLRKQAKKKYRVTKIVEKYISCVEEIINVPILIEHFDKLVAQQKLKLIIEEILLQSRVEFNVEE